MSQIPLTEVLVAAFLVFAAWYLWANAVRVDRLHHAVATARASLSVQLTRRAALAVEAAGRCDPATALILAEAAASALDATVEEEDPARLEEAHNDLTRALVLAFGDPADAREVFGEDDDLAVALRGACLKVQLARRFHNATVATARRRRRKWIVRRLRLAGHAPWPGMVEIDDAVPEGLEQYLPGRPL